MVFALVKHNPTFNRVKSNRASKDYRGQGVKCFKIANPIKQKLSSLHECLKNIFNNVLFTIYH
jgi:hypothetical protein